MHAFLKRSVCATILLVACEPSFVSLAQEKNTEAHAPPDFSAAAHRIIVADYTGPNAADPVYQAAWESIRASRAEVLEEIHRLTGLVLPENKQVRVFFQDQLLHTKDAVINYSVTAPQPYGARIVLSLPAIIARGQDPQQMFQHEMTHALQCAIMGDADYWKLNLWIQEGLATYAGGHGPDWTRRFYELQKRRAPDTRRVAARIINGLEAHESPADYVEDYLAFEFLVQRWGDYALKLFVQEITVRRTPWKQALYKVTGLNWPAFAAAAKQFSTDYIVNLETPTAKTAASAPPPAPKPELGLLLQDLDETAARQLPGRKGVAVAAVVRDSIADRAGLEAGDIVITVGERTVENAAHVSALLDALKLGESVVIKLIRDGQPLAVALRISGGL